MNELFSDVHTIDKCKGLIFRGFSSTFYSNGKIEKREGIRLLKRNSCPGCKNNCMNWLFDVINEEIQCNTLTVPIIKDYQLYTLKVTNLSRDIETGYIDDYDIEIVEIEK